MLTNFGLGRGSGTVRYLMDLGEAMRRRGHECIFYAPINLGECAEELRERGFCVSNDLSALPEPDIIHAQQTFPALEAISAFPSAPLFFIAHDPFWHMGQALPLSITDCYAAVDSVTLERVVSDTGCPESRVNLLGNGVDLEKFTRRAQLPEQPSKALIYSGSYQTTEHFDAIREACRLAGLELDEAISFDQNYFSKPGERLGEYDIIFCKARCAMEAMVSGAYVVLIGDKGIGPPLNLEITEKLRRQNFGYETFTQPSDLLQVLTDQIQAYDPITAGEISDWAYSHLDAERTWEQYDILYREMSAKPACRMQLPKLDQYITRLLLRYSKTDPRLLPDEIKRRKEEEKAERVAQRMAEQAVRKSERLEEISEQKQRAAMDVGDRQSPQRPKTLFEKSRRAVKRLFR